MPRLTPFQQQCIPRLEAILGKAGHRLQVIQWLPDNPAVSEPGAEFMHANPKEAAQIIASVYKMEPAVIENAIRQTGATVDGITYWGPGRINYKGLDNMIRAQKLVGAVKGDVDWSKIVDESFLPEDLRSKK